MKKKVCILGGGISGLTLAYYLQDKPYDITLIEANETLGGWVQTLKEEGFLFEKGPRGFRPKGEEGLATLRLIDALNLYDKVVFASSEARTRYLWRNKHLNALPKSLFSFFTSPLFKGIKRSLISEIFSSPPKEDESIFDFFSKHFSKEFTERLIDPITLGIYAGDIHTLSTESCYPNIFKAAEKHGSIIRGMFKKKRPKAPKHLLPYTKAPLLSFKEGMHQLIDTLHKKTNITFALETKVLKIVSSSPHTLETNKGDFTCDHIISTLPLHQLNTFFPNELPRLPYQSLKLALCGFKQALDIPKGFGFLIPTKEKEKCLGAVFDSFVFPSQNKGDQTRISFFLPHDLENPKEEAQDILKRMVGVSKAPDFLKITEAKNCIGQYPIGYQKEKASALKALSEKYPKIHFLGAGFNGAPVNQCIYHAEALAKTF